MYQEEVTTTKPVDKTEPFVLDVEGVPHIARPNSDVEGANSWEVQACPELLVAPQRQKGLTRFENAVSFCKYVTDYTDIENSSIYMYANPQNFEFTATAVFNDAKRCSPNWRDDKAIYKPLFSSEMLAWKEKNKENQYQEDMAVFLTEHIDDIVGGEDESTSPSAATVLQAVSDLYEVKNVTFGSKVNLDNGMRCFIYSEQDGSKGEIKIPSEFVIGVPLFEGGKAYKIRVKLRYRINRGTGLLTFQFDLQNIEKVFKAAIADDVQLIEKSIPEGIPVYHGVKGID